MNANIANWMVTAEGTVLPNVPVFSKANWIVTGNGTVLRPELCRCEPMYISGKLHHEAGCPSCEIDWS